MCLLIASTVETVLLLVSLVKEILYLIRDKPGWVKTNT